MATQDFDKLNKLRSMPFPDYFKPMHLTKKQYDDRIMLANDLDDFFEELFITIKVLDDSDLGYDSELKNSLVDKLSTLIGKVVGADNINSSMVANIVSDTLDVNDRHKGESYYTSDDRARLLAENDSNTIMNDAEFVQAVANGMTKKTWHTMEDAKVRDSHFILDGKTIDIDVPFQVGTSLMNFPKDDSFGAGVDEIANCRCSVSYSK